MSTTLAELAKIVSSRTKMISDFLAKSNLPGPTFGADGAQVEYLPDNAEIQAARIELENASHQLSELAAGTKRTFQRHCFLAGHEQLAFHTIYAYDIPKYVPPHPGSISYADLSSKCGLEEDKLRRIVRFAMTMHYFYEPASDHVAHTALTKMLVDEPNAMDFLGHCKDEVGRGDTSQVDAMRKWPGSNDKSECGIALAFNLEPGRAFFGLMSAEPHRVQRFANSMKYLSSPGSFFMPDHMLNRFDWSKLGPNAKVVDIGGSIGHASFAIARGAPNCHFVVQDLPDVVSQVKDTDVPAELKDRVRFEGHDFFTPQPIKDADVYFFRAIWHDWPDAECKKILQMLLPAMKPGSRLILNENIMPSEKRTPTTLQDKLQLALDLQMMVALNARERTLEDWMALVGGVSGGRLKLESTVEWTLVFLLTE